MSAFPDRHPFTEMKARFGEPATESADARRIDHRREALTLIEAVSPIDMYAPFAEAVALRLNVADKHIRLAALEQARLANCLAAEERYGSDPAAWPRYIREGLGL